jgi:toxin ParE1/3/4
MGSYKLSNAADEDFENIFDYGIDTFGFDQAIVYQTGMKMRLDELAQNPLRYTAVDHIKKGYRRSVYGSHSIYYRIEKKGVEIVRILGRQDSNAAF